MQEYTPRPGLRLGVEVPEDKADIPCSAGVDGGGCGPGGLSESASAIAPDTLPHLHEGREMQPTAETLEEPATFNTRRIKQTSPVQLGLMEVGAVPGGSRRNQKDDGMGILSHGLKMPLVKLVSEATCDLD
jgi:hypothetical protein